jgi:hypothetical protein
MRGLTKQIFMSALLMMLMCLGFIAPAFAEITNGGFEKGGFEGWIADPNWVVVDNSCGYYSGWAGKQWAWSGGSGEPATGVLKSKPFVLNHDTVQMLVSGWNSVMGTGQPRRWNYVTLNLEDGSEIDRAYAPNMTTFVPVILDGSKHRGKSVFIQAVDDADQPSFSMLCIDDVRAANFPPGFAKPVKRLPAFDPKRSLKIEDDLYRLEVNRTNGSITRIRDKKAGLDLLLEPRLAGSYRFSLPIPGKESWQTLEANWIFGKDQRLTAHTLRGKQLMLRWDGPLKNYLNEAFDVSAVMTIELRDGGILFTFNVDNKSTYAVGETYFPVLGGIQGLGKVNGQLKETEMVLPSGAPETARRRRAAAADAQITVSASPTFTSTSIFKVFTNMSWLGDQGPEQFFAYPKTLPEAWVGFSTASLERSVMLGTRGGTNRDLFVRLELIPASSGNPRDDGNWPRPSELRGAPVGVELSFVDTKGGTVGESYQAEPVFLRSLDGGGPEMLKEYSTW